MDKKKMRVYLDTSVFGGYFDDEFETETRAFFDLASRGCFMILLSDLLANEMENAPLRVRDLVSRIISEGAEHIATTEEAVYLSNAYLAAHVVSRRYNDDALHVALATISRADAIASWNFRHLVNPFRIRAFNGVNMTNGYGSVIIQTPGNLVKVMGADYGRE